jgi:hypothetical protein
LLPPNYHPRFSVTSGVASREFTVSRFPLTSRNPAISAKLALKAFPPPGFSPFHAMIIPLRLFW